LSRERGAAATLERHERRGGARMKIKKSAITNKLAYRRGGRSYINAALKLLAGDFKTGFM